VNSTDSKRKKPAGSSRRLNRDSGRWETSTQNTALLAAMLKALRPQLSKPKITKGKQS
jgi:hypothetical protein